MRAMRPPVDVPASRSTLSRKVGTALRSLARMTADKMPRTPPPSSERILNSGSEQSGEVQGERGGPVDAYLMKGMTGGGALAVRTGSSCSKSSGSLAIQTSSLRASSGSHSTCFNHTFPPSSVTFSCSPLRPALAFTSLSPCCLRVGSATEGEGPCGTPSCRLAFSSSPCSALPWLALTAACLPGVRRSCEEMSYMSWFFQV
mmetsp:Transcript_42134/g.132723  ORF Transcript_42134/g.132723 Transcript_42134/m.132723 type:complete len:202 (-) Transcript_42134:1699-2304(-)